MTAKPLTPKEDVDRLCLKIATEAPRAHLEVATMLRALLAERDTLFQTLQHADALLDAMTPGVDTELTDEECANLWNATRDSVKKTLEKPE